MIQITLSKNLSGQDHFCLKCKKELSSYNLTNRYCWNCLYELCQKKGNKKEADFIANTYL